VIEMMLEAERALAVGLLDQADRLYGQVVAADPGNAIAVVGQARVALERGDQAGAYTLARRALSIDPDNPMARHLAMRMSELLRGRGEPVPADPTRATPPVGSGTPPTQATRPGAPTAVTTLATHPAAPRAPSGPGGPTSGAPARPDDRSAPPAGSPPPRPGLLDRLLRRGTR